MSKQAATRLDSAHISEVVGSVKVCDEALRILIETHQQLCRASVRCAAPLHTAACACRPLRPRDLARGRLALASPSQLRSRLGGSDGSHGSCSVEIGGEPKLPAFSVSALAEERQHDRRRRVGDRQSLRAQLLLHLQRLQAGRFLGEVGVDEVADTGFDRIRQLAQEASFERRAPSTCAPSVARFEVQRGQRSRRSRPKRRRRPPRSRCRARRSAWPELGRTLPRRKSKPETVSVAARSRRSRHEHACRPWCRRRRRSKPVGSSAAPVPASSVELNRERFEELKVADRGRCRVIVGRGHAAIGRGRRPGPGSPGSCPRLRRRSIEWSSWSLPLVIVKSSWSPAPNREASRGRQARRQTRTVAEPVERPRP